MTWLEIQEMFPPIGIHFSSTGVIPKKGKPGKWRLIVNLLAPSGGSVNDGVDKESIRFSYTSVDAIADRVVALGRGSQLAKMDIKQAYRMIPVHPEDRYLLGMLWEGVAYVDKTLPFGLRSAPFIFTAVADALQWIMVLDGATFVDHYTSAILSCQRQGDAQDMRGGRTYIAVRGTCPGFFFRFEDGRLLTKDRFINGVRHVMTACGVDAKAYAGHSFRIGAATTAAKKEMSTKKNKTLGRWASAAYRRTGFNCAV